MLERWSLGGNSVWVLLLLASAAAWPSGKAEAGARGPYRDRNHEETNFQGVDFRGQDLRRARFERSDLRGADLRVEYRRMRGASFERAVIDETTELPVQWGRTQEERVNFGMALGMVLEPTEGFDPNQILRFLDNTGHCRPEWIRRLERYAPPGAVMGGDPSPGGVWRGELGGVEGELRIHRVAEDRYIGGFNAEDYHHSMGFTIWAERDSEGRLTNRMFVEWVDLSGESGRGWILTDRDRVALMGRIGWCGSISGFADISFVRSDEAQALSALDDPKQEAWDPTSEDY
ncbi:MAG: pentapeptide repeat-containing protein [Bdellovibrionales bacterium]|nr:pentapeptide repeat-containing protein [Bdellovibrionales bacterium]